MSLDNDLLENNEILIFGEIDKTLAFETICNLRWLSRNGDKDKPILIFINSEGGDVDAACSIMDEIRLLKSTGRTIYTIGMGEVASAAIFILMVGSRRFGYEHTSYMMHPCSYNGKEDYHQQNKSLVLFMDRFWDGLMVELAVACQTPPKDIKKFTEKIKDTIWLDTESAIEFKLIEGVWPIDENSNK
jgi:ATP-dependent protease ClpP protease subunit